MRFAATFVLIAGAAFAGSAPDPTAAQIDDIITKFAAKEAEFARVRGNYTYRQTVKIQELDDNGNPMGKHEMVTDIVFTPEGRRIERVVYAPVDSLKVIGLTQEDEQDLRDVQPFVLTTSEIPNYYIRYQGREQLDEISCYSFAVKPKAMQQGKRYFEGIIWVDDKDLQIVKTYGRGIGLLKKNSDYQFPKFETYREQIDGKYWFPTYTIANDTLNFKDISQRIRQTIRYENYKQFKSDVVIKYGDVTDDPKDQPKTTTPGQPPAPPKKKQ
jgi:hypothetical protein